MKRMTTGILTAIVTACILVLPSSAQASPPLVTVSGGGTADFVDFEGSTQFAVGAVIREDGSVTGHFTCMIVQVVTISGVVTDYDLNLDGEGNLESVTLRGTAHGPDHFSGEIPFFGCDFEVTLWPGGPGVGGFLYRDCVVPPPGDLETVRKGHIMIHQH